MTRLLAALALVCACAFAIPASADDRYPRLERKASLHPAHLLYHRAGRRTVHRPMSDGQSNAIVSIARRYIGTNPTGWARLWCARFMNLVLEQAGYRGTGSNAARSFAALPRTGAQVGAIAVLARRGGGHVGVVSGFDARGNPILISGNHNKRVAEAVYPRARVIAFVRPL